MISSVCSRSARGSAAPAVLRDERVPPEVSRRPRIACNVAAWFTLWGSATAPPASGHQARPCRRRRCCCLCCPNRGRPAEPLLRCCTAPGAEDRTCTMAKENVGVRDDVPQRRVAFAHNSLALASGTGAPTGRNRTEGEVSHIAVSWTGGCIMDRRLRRLTAALSEAAGAPGTAATSTCWALGRRCLGSAWAAASCCCESTCSMLAADHLWPRRFAVACCRRRYEALSELAVIS